MPAGHELSTQLHRDPVTGYDHGWFAVCTCTWTGPLRDLNRRGQALRDGYQHLIEMKEAAA